MAIQLTKVQGQLPSTKGTIYTVPASTSAVIKNIRCYNTAGTSENVTIFLKDSAGTSITIINISVSGNSMLSDTDQYHLEAADLIEGVTTTATTVDYWISIAEVT